MSTTHSSAHRARRSSATAAGHVASPAGGAGQTQLPLPSARTAFVVLLLVTLTLFSLSLLDIALGRPSSLLRQFDTGDEANAATWFSSTMWLIAGVLAFAIGGAGRRLRAPGASRWLLLGGTFALLALDETAQLHEQAVGPLMDAVKRVTGLAQTPGRMFAAGCVGVVLLAGAAWLWPWLRALPPLLARRLASPAPSSSVARSASRSCRGWPRRTTSRRSRSWARCSAWRCSSRRWCPRCTP